jgi:putative oxidoreductase
MQKAAAMGTALLRISMGLLFLAHVALRLTVITWPVALLFFRSLGLPWFMGYAVTITEVCVGILLIIGWHVRIAALAGAAILLGAICLVHAANGFLFTNAGGGWEYPAFWAIALICQSLLGAGCWSLRSTDGAAARANNSRIL